MPWRVVKTDKDVYIYSAYSEAEKKRFPYSNGRLIATVSDYTAFSQKKNAQLIAAAPELLTAAKLALAYFNKKEPAGPGAIENKLAHVLQKVIAKAEDHEEEECN
nr:hypothetical protein [Bacillus glycinifermentans]